MPHGFQTHHQPGSSATESFLLYLALASGIALTLSLHYVFKHRVFAFADIGVDLFTYYYPLQIIQAQQLRELHTLAWSFQLGLGGYIGSVFNPTQLVTAWLPEDWQLGVRLPTYFLKLILSGAFFFGYLRRIRFEHGLAVIGALAFAFSSYSIVNGQWDTQGLIALQFAAYLFFFESFFRSGNFWYAVAAGLTVGSGSAFDVYSFSLLSLLYIIVRPSFTSKGDDRSPFLPALLRYGCFAALGFLVTAAIQVPNIVSLLDSPRVSGDHAVFSSLFSKLSEINNGKVINAEIAGMFGKDLLGTANKYRGWSNYFEAPGFYVGMLLLLCMPQLLGPAAKRHERLLCSVGFVLLILYMVWPAMRYAVYGFGHIGFRLSTLWVSAGLLVLGLAGLRRAFQSGTWRPGLLASCVGIVVVVLAIGWHAQAAVVVSQVALVIAFTSIYGIVLWSSGKDGQGISIQVLACLFACELLLFSVPALMQRDAVRTDGTSTHGTYNDGTQAALALVRQIDGSQDFYRIEKTYQSVFLNDALVQGYNGTKSYWFHDSSITRFVDKMNLPRTNPRSNYIGSMARRPDILDLLGVKYLLSRDRKLDDKPGMDYVGRAGKIHVYRNTGAHGFGHLYRDVVAEETASKLPLPQRDALLLERVVVENPEEIRTRLGFLDKARGAGNSGLDAHVSLRKVSDVYLHADVSTPLASVFLISMPFDAGWSARIDGSPAGLFRADYGLTALLLPPGRHQVDLRYVVPGRVLGKWLSLAALSLLFAIGSFQALSVMRRRKQKPIEPEPGTSSLRQRS
jgi:hypothetical protein